MKQVFKKITVSAFLLIFLITIVLPGAGIAGPPPPMHGFRHVPPGSHRIDYRHTHYIFHKGRYYKPGRDGYVFARPPMGLIVYSLPAAVTAVVIAGMTYYMLEDVYYRKVPTGYQVVEVPRATTSVVTYTAKPMAPGSQVVVQAKILNVRSGPGLEHPIVTQVFGGNVLTVQGNAPQWLYVRLPDNTNGWVMETFVSEPDSEPKG